MSINAVVISALKQASGETRLELAGPERGQSALYTSNPPDDIEQLVGCQVWGGSNFLMYGETQIAKRESYVSLCFTVASIAEVLKKEQARKAAK